MVPLLLEAMAARLAVAMVVVVTAAVVVVAAVAADTAGVARTVSCIVSVNCAAYLILHRLLIISYLFLQMAPPAPGIRWMESGCGLQERGGRQAAH